MARARATARSFISFHALNTYSNHTHKQHSALHTNMNESTKQNARRRFAHCKLENRRKGSMKTLLFTYWSTDYICEQRCVLINIYYCLLQSICVQVTSSRCSSTDVTSATIENSFDSIHVANWQRRRRRRELQFTIQSKCEFNEILCRKHEIDSAPP